MHFLLHDFLLEGPHFLGGSIWRQNPFPQQTLKLLELPIQLSIPSKLLFEMAQHLQHHGFLLLRRRLDWIHLHSIPIFHHVFLHLHHGNLLYLHFPDPRVGLLRLLLEFLHHPKILDHPGLIVSHHLDHLASSGVVGHLGHQVDECFRPVYVIFLSRTHLWET